MGGSLDAMCSLTGEVEDSSVVFDAAANLTISTAESRARDVRRDDPSEGMPVLPTCSGPSLEASAVEFTMGEEESDVEVIPAMT